MRDRCIGEFVLSCSGFGDKIRFGVVPNNARHYYGSVDKQSGVRKGDGGGTEEHTSEKTTIFKSITLELNLHLNLYSLTNHCLHKPV